MMAWAELDLMGSRPARSRAGKGSRGGRHWGRVIRHPGPRRRAACTDRPLPRPVKPWEVGGVEGRW